MTSQKNRYIDAATELDAERERNRWRDATEIKNLPLTTGDYKVKQWITDIISGVGGLHDYERYEMAVRNGDPDEAVAIWVIKCLANPKCEGSKEVLDAIAERRAELKP